MIKPIFKSSTATGLLRYAEGILLKMTQNISLFPEPNPTLASLEGSLSTYREAYAEANFRDTRAVLIKGKTGKDLQEIIYRLSHYVDAIAKGDAEIIVAAGFTASSLRGNAGKTPQAQGVTISNVQVGTGVLRIKVNPWKYARIYRYDYRKKDTEAWTSVLHSKSTLEISALEMMQTYEFRVSYIGTDTEPNFSPIVSAIAV
ncbi:hypothetical protein [Sphingobacterium sp. LRF_L2]|uniref:hypothetical protein n=1 Tax=Sphingobacterium sp. LRF_L2 TaxID=3369421 RepID=UPI003F5FBFB8